MDNAKRVACLSLTNARKCLETGNFGRAFANFLLFLKLEPSRDHEVYLEFSLATREWCDELEQSNRIEDLFNCYHQASELYPNHDTVLNNIGAQLFRLGYVEEAAAYIRRSLIINPNYLAAQENLENICSHLVERWHFAMLNDKRRNGAYKFAIEKAIKCGYDTVLDIGTGTSILSLMSESSGASTIFACDSSRAMVEVAGDVLMANNVSDRVKLIHKSSTQLNVPQDLPQKVKLVVTEIFDAGLFGEHAVSSLIHAWRNLISTSPMGTIIPCGATMYVCGIECETIRQQNRLLYPVLQHLDLSHVDVHSTTGQVAEEPYTTENLAKISRGYRIVTNIAELLRVNFCNLYELESLNKGKDWTCNLHIKQNGHVDALAVWFDLQLDDSVTIATGADNKSCWEQAIYPVCTNFMKKDSTGHETLMARKKDTLQTVFHFEQDCLRLVNCEIVRENQSPSKPDTSIQKTCGCQGNLETAQKQSSPLVLPFRKRKVDCASAMPVDCASVMPVDCVSVMTVDCASVMTVDCASVMPVDCASDMQETCNNKSNTSIPTVAGKMDVCDSLRNVSIQSDAKTVASSHPDTRETQDTLMPDSLSERHNDVETGMVDDSAIHDCIERGIHSSLFDGISQTQENLSQNSCLQVDLYPSLSNELDVDKCSQCIEQYDNVSEEESIGNTKHHLDTSSFVVKEHERLDGNVKVLTQEDQMSDLDEIGQIKETLSDPLEHKGVICSSNELQITPFCSEGKLSCDTSDKSSFVQDQNSDVAYMSPCGENQNEPIKLKSLQNQNEPIKLKSLQNQDPNEPIKLKSQKNQIQNEPIRLKSFQRHLCLVDQSDIEYVNDIHLNKLYIEALSQFRKQHEDAEDLSLLYHTQRLSFLGIQACKLGFDTVIMATPSEHHGTLRQVAELNDCGKDSLLLVDTEAMTALQTSVDMILCDIVEPYGALGQQVFENITFHSMTSLQANGIVWPQGVKIFGMYIESDELESLSHVTGNDKTLDFVVAEYINVFQMKNHVNIDLSTLSYTKISEVFELMSIDLNNISQSDSSNILDQSVERNACVTTSGKISALVYWFELKLSDNIVVNTIDERCHWKQAAIMMKKEIYGIVGQNLVSTVTLQNSCLDVKIILPQLQNGIHLST